MKNRSIKQVAMIVANGVIGDSRVLKTARSVSSMGYKVRVYGINPDNTANEPLHLNEYALDIVLFPNISSQDNPNLCSKEENYIQNFVDFLEKDWQQGLPSILHTHDMRGLAIGAKLYTENRFAWVHDIHEYVEGLTGAFPEEIKDFYADIEKKSIHIPHHLLSVSPALNKILVDRYNLKKTPALIYNAPAYKLFDAEYKDIKSSLNISTDTPLIVYSGNTKEVKGISTLIKALPLVPGVHLAIVSNRDSSAKFEAQAKILGVLNRVHSVPYVPFDKVSSFLRTADLGIHPIKSYPNADIALPTKLFEYMHSGIFAITSNLPAMSQFIKQNKNGFTFRVDDSKSLAQAIKIAFDITKKDPKYKEHLKELSRKYSWEEQELVLSSVYDNLVKISRNIIGKARSQELPVVVAKVIDNVYALKRLAHIPIKNAKKIIVAVKRYKNIQERYQEQRDKLLYFADRAKKAEAQIKDYEGEIGEIAKIRTNNAYCSLTPGNKEMEAKWESVAKGKRILFVATKDFAGSFYKWAMSLHKYSDYAVRMVTLTTHQYGYELDLVFPANNTNYYKKLLPLIEEADIIHFKDEQVPFFALANPAAQSDHDSYRLKLPAPKADDFMRFLFKEAGHKPKVFTHYGSFSRLWQNDELYKDFVKNNFDALIAMTADLNFEWFSGTYVPQAIDVDKFEYTWQDTKIIAHSPSTASRKGTHEFMIAAEEIVKGYPDWKIDLIQGLRHSECLARKGGADLFFDQAGRESNDRLAKDAVIGFYGNSALEAMVHGIPTIAHIAQWAFDGAARGGKDWSTSPILNPKPTDVESMKEIIEQFVKMSPQERQALSLRTREWTVANHSEQAVAGDLAKVYDKVLSADLSNKDLTPIKQLFHFEEK